MLNPWITVQLCQVKPGGAEAAAVSEAKSDV